MVKYYTDNPDLGPELDTDFDTLIAQVYGSVRNFSDTGNRDASGTIRYAAL